MTAVLSVTVAAAKRQATTGRGAAALQVTASDKANPDLRRAWQLKGSGSSGSGLLDCGSSNLTSDWPESACSASKIHNVLTGTSCPAEAARGSSWTETSCCGTAGDEALRPRLVLGTPGLPPASLCLVFFLAKWLCVKRGVLGADLALRSAVCFPPSVTALAGPSILDSACRYKRWEHVDGRSLRTSSFSSSVGKELLRVTGVFAAFGKFKHFRKCALYRWKTFAPPRSSKSTRRRSGSRYGLLGAELHL